jgi:Fic family protein
VKSEIQRIKALLGFRNKMFTQIKSSGARGMITEMPETILATPYFTVQRIADKHQVSYPAASSVISKLVDLGFLREITGKSYGKLFICNEVLNILNS